MSCVLVVCLLVCFFFEVEFHVQNGCVAKSGLELLILLPLFPESWGGGYLWHCLQATCLFMKCCWEAGVLLVTEGLPGICKVLGWVSRTAKQKEQTSKR